jgi:hypothetical protein
MASLAGCWELRSQTDRLDASASTDMSETSVTHDVAMDLTRDAGQDTLPEVVSDSVLPADVPSDTSGDISIDLPMDIPVDSLRDVTAERLLEASVDVTTDVSVDVPAVRPQGQPVLPPSGGYVYSQRPRFEVALPPGSDGATVEICTDRLCTTILATVSLTTRVGNRISGTTPAVVLPGRYWWRAFVTTGGVRGDATATWRFVVLRNLNPNAVGVGPGPLDVANDGLSDFVANCGSGWRLYSAGSMSPTVSLLGELTATGDFNGDGFGDVANIASTSRTSALILRVYLGSETGLSNMPWMLSFAGDSEVKSLASAGDFNRDGYTDLVLDRVPGAGLRAVTVVFGGFAAITMGPDLSDLANTTMTQEFGASGIGDFNGDGYEDLAVGVPSTRGPGGRIFTNGSFAAASMIRAYGPEGTPRPGGDANGDGMFDILVARSDRVTLVHSGVPVSEPVRLIAFGYTAFADFNTDGLSDTIVAGDYRSAIVSIHHIRASNGTTFEPSYPAFFADRNSPPSAGFATGAVVGYYNNDEIPDLLLRVEIPGTTPFSRIMFYRGNSTSLDYGPNTALAHSCGPVVAW